MQPRQLLAAALLLAGLNAPAHAMDLKAEKATAHCGASPPVAQKERIFVALCVACGLPAVGVPVFRGESFPHVMAAAFVPIANARGFVTWRWMEVDPTIQNSGIGWIPPYRFAQTNHW